MKLLLFIYLFYCFSIYLFIQCIPQYKVPTVGELTTCKNYLVRFGYVDTFSVNSKELATGLERLQYFANIPTTGLLDVATLKQLTLPRCGLQDPRINIRVRKFVHQGSTWKKSKLSWRLEGTGRTLARETVLQIMHKAFSFWSDVTNLDFVETIDEEPDIWVRFVRYSHGDPYAFDGEGGTLAHAFYPHNNEGLSGDVHFDDDEHYTAESSQGRNLLWVATHEIGHSIGMEHSNIREAVMYPWYTKYKPGFNLNYDDIVGIQSLYGSRRKTTTTTSTTTTTTTPKTTITTTTTTPTTTTTTTTTPTTTTTTTTPTTTTTTTTPTTTTTTTTPTTTTTTTTPTTTTSTTTTPTTTTTTPTTTTTTPATTTTKKTTLQTTKTPRKTTATTARSIKTTESVTKITDRPNVISTTKPRRPCPSGTITAIYYNRYAQMKIIMTDNGKMYFVNDFGIRYGPVRTANYLPKNRINQPIDSSYTATIYGRDYTVFFAGTSYYLYEHFRFISGPHSIHGDNNPLEFKFPKWVRRIDAVMKWYHNGRTYFFYNGLYWRYDNTFYRFDLGYPRYITSAWRGLPKKIDAAFSSKKEKKTFIISGNLYYEINDTHARVKSGYPKYIGDGWLNCGSTPSKIVNTALNIAPLQDDQIITEP